MNFRKFFVTLSAGAAVMAGAGALSSGRVLAGDAPVTEAETKTFDMDVRMSGEAVFQSGISVAGQSLEGMTIEEADSFIDQYVQTRQQRAITLTVFGDNVYNYNGESFGVTWSNPDLKDTIRSYLPTGNFIEQYKMQKTLDVSPEDLTIDLTFDQSSLSKVVSDLAAYFTSDPVDATVTRQNGAFVVTPEVTGHSFDTDSIVSELTAQISDWANTDAINYDLPYTDVPAQWTSANFAFSDTPLGEWSTGNLGIPNRTANIELSASRVNGTVLYPGQQTSALTLYGPQTEDDGYLVAPGYEEGKQVPAVGGGVCQTTTTLYNALIRAEVTILQRSAHSMIVTYVAPALDAAVAEGSKDLVFRNDFSNPIYLEMFVSNGTLYARVYGIDEDPYRRVDFSWQVLDVQFPNPLYNVVVNNDIATYGAGARISSKAVADVETHPYVKAVSYRHVYVTDANGVETETEVTQWNSDTYRQMTGTIYIASDCNVSSQALPSSSPNAVYKYLGWDIYHSITFKNGQPWNPSAASGNYTP